MKSQVLHTVWCNMTGEATGEIWSWSLLGVKGLRHYLVVSIRPRSHITITKQLGESWLELVEVVKRWKLGSSWAKIWAGSNSSQLYPTRANSSQVGCQTIPNSIEVVNLAWTRAKRELTRSVHQRNRNRKKNKTRSQRRHLFTRGISCIVNK